jgi:hypothetical protein
VWFLNLSRSLKLNLYSIGIEDYIKKWLCCQLFDTSNKINWNLKRIKVQLGKELYYRSNYWFAVSYINYWVVILHAKQQIFQLSKDNKKCHLPPPKYNKHLAFILVNLKLFSHPSLV